MLAAIVATAALLAWRFDRPAPSRAVRRAVVLPIEESPSPERPAIALNDVVGGEEALRALLPRLPKNGVGDFHEYVLDLLGRVPRQSILDVLADEWLRKEDGDYAGYCRALREKIPRSDLILLWYGYNLNVVEGPPPFVRTRRKGADPYLNPAHFLNFDDFVGWYPAYCDELELPSLNEEEKRTLHESWIAPLGRLPTADELRLGIRLLRQLESRHAKIREKYGDYEFNTLDKRAIDEDLRVAAREFFAAVQRELPAEYDRLRTSDFWQPETSQAGLLHDGE